jgi:hypothetical protein
LRDPAVQQAPFWKRTLPRFQKRVVICIVINPIEEVRQSLKVIGLAVDDSIGCLARLLKLFFSELNTVKRECLAGRDLYRRRWRRRGLRRNLIRFPLKLLISVGNSGTRRLRTVLSEGWIRQ